MKTPPTYRDRSDFANPVGPPVAVKNGIVCECGHDLGTHPPDPNRPFAWPCRTCSCSEYKEKTSS